MMKIAMPSKTPRLICSLVILFYLFGCASISPSRPTVTPEPSLTPTTAPTFTPAPVYEKILTDGLVLSPANANLIEKLADLWPHNMPVADATFYDNGSIALATSDSSLASGGGPSSIGNFALQGDSRVTLWDIRTNSPRELFSAGEGKDTYSRLAVSPDRKWIALAGSTAIVLGELQADASDGPSFQSTSIDLSELKEQSAFANSPLVGAAFSPDSHLLAVTGQSGSRLVWDVQAGRKLAAVPVIITDQTFNVSSCMFSSYGAAFSADGKTLLYACDAALYGWDFGPSDPTSLGIAGETVFTLNPSGSLIAGGDYFGKVGLWSYPSKHTGSFEEPQTALSGQATLITALAFSPDGGLLASASQDGKIVVYDVAKGINLITLEGPSDILAFSPDGKFLLSGARFGGGSLWGVRAGSLNTERTGVKVILSEGSVSLMDWQALIPSAWLTPKGSFPRYEIRINSDWVEGQTCNYSGDSGSGFVTRRRPTVSVEIADVETKTVLGQKVFSGGDPGECPEKWTFAPLAPSDFIDGTPPDPTPFGPWLMEIMSKVGLK